MITYLIEIIEVETGEAFYHAPYTLNEAITHCIDGQRETGDEFTHEIYTIH